jgi:N-acetylglucosaminyldiphosphoundecaprenol N-acetyl-beta-D-mannosaminyltransferase
MTQALDLVGRWIAASEYECRYVVTPNVDHIVKLQSDDQLRSAYSNASLVVADGWPLVAASRLLGKPLPERVTGSDMVPRLFDLSVNPEPLRVFLLGAAPGVADIAKVQIERSWRNVQVCGTYSPPLGFEHSAELNADIVARVNRCKPDVLIVGLGAPKQEIWLDRFRTQLRVKVAIAAGATIDFLAGEQQRAPKWVQRIALEWLHRILTDPRRLAGRYLYGAWAFPRIVAREAIRPTRLDRNPTP